MLSLSPALRIVLVMSYIDVVGTVTVATVAWVYKHQEKNLPLWPENQKKRSLRVEAGGENACNCFFFFLFSCCFTPRVNVVT